MKTQCVLVDGSRVVVCSAGRCEATIQLSVKDLHFRLELHMDPGHAPVKRAGKEGSETVAFVMVASVSS